MKRYKDGCKAQDNFKAALTVTKDGGKKDYTIDGKKVSCTGYKTIVSKDSMIDFLKTSSDFFLKDKQLRQDFIDRLQLAVEFSNLMGQSMGAASTSPESLTDENYEQAKQEVKEIIDQLDKNLDDVNMSVYVDKKGRLAAVNGVTMLHVSDENEPMKISFNLELNGGSYLTQNYKGTIDLTMNDESAHFNIARTGKFDGKTLKDQLEIDASTPDGSDFVVGLMSSYKDKSGDYSLGLNVSADGENVISASAKGAVDELQKGKGIHANIDDLNISLADSDYISLSGEYYWRPLKGNVTAPKGETMDVLSATSDKWGNVEAEMYKNLYGLLTQIGS